MLKYETLLSDVFVDILQLKLLGEEQGKYDIVEAKTIDFSSNLRGAEHGIGIAKAWVH